MNSATKQKTYPTMQFNGQRIYFPSSKSAPPPRGSEVFIGNLPYDVYEDELIPLFSQAGPIYKLRLMMDFYGSTRGFAFLSYHSAEDANLAVLRFHDYTIRAGIYLTVHISVDNCRLFLGNISRRQSARQIQDFLVRFVDGVVQVIVYEEETNPRKNRGFAFVEFQTHALAAIARRKMWTNVECLWGRKRKVIVDWAHPDPVVHPLILMQVKILYFKNIPSHCTQHRFKRFIWNILGKKEIERIYKKQNYAFVHFRTRESAEMALQKWKSEHLMIYSRQIEVEWARPVSYSRKMRWNEIPDNFCMSVPPEIRRIVRNSKREYCRNRQISSESSESSDSRTDGYMTETENFLADRLHQILTF